METLANKKRQLVGILAWSRNANRSWPIVIKMCQLVSQSVMEYNGIIKHVIANGECYSNHTVACDLASGLSHHVPPYSAWA